MMGIPSGFGRPPETPLYYKNSRAPRLLLTIPVICLLSLCLLGLGSGLEERHVRSGDLQAQMAVEHDGQLKFRGTVPQQPEGPADPPSVLDEEVLDYGRSSGAEDDGSEEIWLVKSGPFPPGHQRPEQQPEESARTVGGGLGGRASVMEISASVDSSRKHDIGAKKTPPDHLGELGTLCGLKMNMSSSSMGTQRVTSYVPQLVGNLSRSSLHPPHNSSHLFFLMSRSPCNELRSHTLGNPTIYLNHIHAAKNKLSLS